MPEEDGQIVSREANVEKKEPNHNHVHFSDKNLKATSERAAETVQPPPTTTVQASGKPVYFCKRNSTDIVKVHSSAGKREVEVIRGTNSNDGWQSVQVGDELF